MDMMYENRFRIEPQLKAVYVAAETQISEVSTQRPCLENHTEEIIWAQRRLYDAVQRLEDRLLHRMNPVA
jgi:hypothetical protein